MYRTTALELDRALARELDLNDKMRRTASRNGSGDNAPTERSAGATAAGSAQQSWQEWVDDHIEARLSEFGEAIMEAVFSHLGPKTKELKRENELLQREVIQLRETVALERSLKDLREQVEAAKNDVPKLPAIARRLEESQARLQREIADTKGKVSKLRVDQSIAAHRLADLTKETKKQTANVEMQIERTVASFKTEIHPAAAATLRAFADATLKGSPHEHEKIWIFNNPDVCE
jgi:chromosome segregation ATPase